MKKIVTFTLFIGLLGGIYAQKTRENTHKKPVEYYQEKIRKIRTEYKILMEEFKKDYPELQKKMMKEWKNNTSKTNKIHQEFEWHHNKLKEQILIQKLAIAPEQEARFKELFSTYQDSQRKIKKRFKNNGNFPNLSTEEAEKKLNESFLIGEQLLENRKKFAQNAKDVLTPQQLLELFKNEWLMNNKRVEKKGYS